MLPDANSYIDIGKFLYAQGRQPINAAETGKVEYRAGLVMTSTGLVGTVAGGCVDLLAGKTLSYMTSGATGTKLLYSRA
jgi:hypothetical protein